MTAPLAKAFSRIHRYAAMIEMQACVACTFVQTKHSFPDESLVNLYCDYRSDSYNRERIHYEPEYQSVAQQIGSSSVETETRIETLTTWLHDKIVADGDFSMLDYGGADGKFLPRISGRKFVYEISDVQPTDGMTLIRSESDLTAAATSNSLTSWSTYPNRLSSFRESHIGSYKMAMSTSKCHRTLLTGRLSN